MSGKKVRVAVIGAGPLGAATARHLAERGTDVTVFGPAEPADYAEHAGTWAGHYDEGRIAATDPLMVATLLGQRAMRRYGSIERASNVTFSRPHPQLMMFPDPNNSSRPQTRGGSRAYRQLDALLANSRDFAVMPEVLDQAQLRHRFEQMNLPENQIGVLQHDAFIVNPRKLVEAELVLAHAAGAQRHDDLVTALDPDAHGVRVGCSEGAEDHFDQVVVAIGSATNASGLLPRAIDTEVYGATIVLLEVAGPDSVEMPSLMYLDSHHGGGLITPPTRYPDGRWYLKCASGELLDNVLRDSEAIAAWVRTGGTSSEIEYFEQHVAQLLPGAEILSARTWPCVPSTNITNVPYIDRIGEHTTLLVEGERGVMMADEIGRLGADLCLDAAWTDSLPHELLRARWVE